MKFEIFVHRKWKKCWTIPKMRSSFSISMIWIGGIRHLNSTAKGIASRIKSLNHLQTVRIGSSKWKGFYRNSSIRSDAITRQILWSVSWNNWNTAEVWYHVVLGFSIKSTLYKQYLFGHIHLLSLCSLYWCHALYAKIFSGKIFNFRAFDFPPFLWYACGII